MRRRGLTVLLGAVLAVLLIWQIGAATIPYVMLSPGPTANVVGEVDGKEVIEITGTPTTDSAGQLRMLTVSVHSSTDLLTALRGWISDEDAVVPRELIYPPDQTQEQVEEQNQQDFQNSQSSAETAALRELGYPVKVTVTEVAPGGPAEGRLKAGDVVDTVDGAAVTSTQKLLGLIRSKPAGSTLKIGYTRGGKPAETEVTTVPASDTDDTPRINVNAKNEQPHPFQIKIVLEDIGGPSAGMMFALGIIDKVKTQDLTDGKIIAGTGTIDDEGNVGPIGGIPQKIYGARDAGAKYFLTPADNCKEAAANAVPEVRLIKVATLDEALAALEGIRTGAELPSC